MSELSNFPTPELSSPLLDESEQDTSGEVRMVNAEDVRQEVVASIMSTFYVGGEISSAEDAQAQDELSGVSDNAVHFLVDSALAHLERVGIIEARED